MIIFSIIFKRELALTYIAVIKIKLNNSKKAALDQYQGFGRDSVHKIIHTY